MSVSRVKFRALDPKHPADLVPLGGGSIFMRELRDFLGKEKAKGREWEITIVAHSMGAIVANEIIRNHGDLPITNIVYMAAATSLRDYEDTIFPYLRRRNEGLQKPAVNMYHLTLHRAAEVRDRVTALKLGVFDFAPRGSLLVWIDNYLSRPNIPLDRTAGRFVNLMTEVHNTPAELRSAIHIRELDVGEQVKETQPQQHGDFGRIRFWEPGCWYDGPYVAGGCYEAHRKQGEPARK